MSDKSSQFGNAGGVRSMSARWVVTGAMKLESAAHFGGESETAVDMAVLRDPKEGRPLLPGTSLAGALRSHLADVLGGYGSSEHKNVALLFGGARSDDLGSQSPLIVFDSLGQMPEDLTLEIRDGVAIDPAIGTAEDHKKFDFEVLPAGTIFPLRMELIIEAPEREGLLIGLLMAALNGLAEGDIALGMRRSRGLGAVKVHNWKALRYDLTSKQGWLDWVTSDHQKAIGDDVQSYESVAKAIRAACPSLQIDGAKDNRCRLIVDLEMEISGDLLVRSPARNPEDPDVVHLHSAGKPVFPGTGFAGALRAQALRIARLVRENQGDGDEWVDRLFGPRLERHGENGQRAKAMASKLRVRESFIENGAQRNQTRIAIDRFTGGVVQGALFDEKVQAGGGIRVQLELRNPSDAETGFLLLLLKDLLSGEIPVGGAVSVGRGILWVNKARIRLADGKDYEIAKDLTVEEEARKVFDEKIKSFNDARPLKSQEEKP